MIVKYTSNLQDTDFTKGKEYKVLAIEYDLYRIVDDTDDDYLYPPEWFEVVDDDMTGVKVIKE